MNDAETEMWLCADCEAWVGYKLTECLHCGRSRPRLPVRTVDVPEGEAWRVSDRQRAVVKARKALGRVRR